MFGYSLYAPITVSIYMYKAGASWNHRIGKKSEKAAKFCINVSLRINFSLLLGCRINVLLGKFLHFLTFLNKKIRILGI